MNHLFLTLSSRFYDVLGYLNEKCKPNPKYIKGHIEQRVAHTRNQIFLLIQSLMLFFFFLNIITGNGPILSNLQGCVITLLFYAVMYTSCRYHHEIFRVFYNLSALLCAALLTQHGEMGIHGAWLAGLSFPHFVFLVTGSIKHFIFHIVAQGILINTYYQKPMENSLIHTSPDAFLASFTYHSNEVIVYTIGSTLFIQYVMKNAYYQALNAEKKREELEKQKNFLLGFSHELRNLINSLMGNVKLASLEKTIEKSKDLLLNAEVCAELLLHMVNNILDTGKVEIGELEVNPSQTKIYEIMERVWSVCSELIKRKNLKGQLSIHRSIPQLINIDYYRLTQIFLNLIGNAVKFTDTGKIDIAMEWIPEKTGVDEHCFQPYPFNDDDEQDEGLFEKNQAFKALDNRHLGLSFDSKRINKSLLNSQDEASRGVLKISVTDTGTGISKEGISRLFQRFSQVTSDTSRKKLGTGLGLFITKELCEKMGGEIKVFSRLNQGTSFVFCLPVESFPSQDSEDLTPSEPDVIKKILDHTKLASLVVDDNQFSSDLHKSFLNKLGVKEVKAAKNGLEAYEYFKNQINAGNKMDLIIMDLDMPIMHGRELAQKIRNFEVIKKLKPCLLIIASGNCAESEIKECIDKNGSIRANAFLKKPVRMDEISRTISSHFSGFLRRPNINPNM